MKNQTTMKLKVNKVLKERQKQAKNEQIIGGPSLFGIF